jgi:hypothetical protein
MRRLKSWKELLATPLGSGADIGTGAPLAPLTLTPLLTVTMPANRLVMTPEALVGIILAQLEDNDVDLIAEPSPELVASWKRPEVCPGWQAWGPFCLVCHGHVPEGEAVAYPFVFGSRACLETCADLVDDLLRIYDRSSRGHWRPTRQVHTVANGARCYACRVTL